VTVVDPGDAGPVREWLEHNDRRLGAVLLTHRHQDHVGGAAELAAEHDVTVAGPAGEDIEAVSAPVAEGDSISPPGTELELAVLEVPGHTAGHVVYTAPGMLLSGDTLFAGGCGRAFEGTPAQLYQSLCRLTELPGDTAVLCGHEYTEANLRFASEVEPDNEHIAERLDNVRRLREQGRPSLPSTIALELETNPFLRCHLPTVQEAAERVEGRSLDSPAEVFAVIRKWKDGFR
jgi:hydroxyacylglutathione hydrolase